MTALLHLQNQFQNYLLKNQVDIEKSIVSTANVSVNQRLGIYLDAYRYRLLDSLMSNFPILSTYLGPEKFHQLGGNYIDKFPSPYRSIRWYGDSFSAYLKQLNESFLAELAEFEWKMTLSFDAADDEVLKIEQMAAIPPEAWPELQFKPHASLQRMDFVWNAVKIWEAISNEQPPEKPAQNTELTRWALWRHDYLNRFYTLSEEEAWALDALIKGSTFSELCEGLCQWYEEEEVGMQAASVLKGWIQSGLLAEVI